jgi:hypothetical protein
MTPEREDITRSAPKPLNTGAPLKDQRRGQVLTFSRGQHKQREASVPQAMENLTEHRR